MLGEVKKRYPNLKFQSGSTFVWSPQASTVFYNQELVDTPRGGLALLHEIGHALLGHQTYQLDLELLNMEVEAWIKARELADHHELEIDEEHIENCLETYRIWLFKRSRCPTCENTSLQQDETNYRCFVCGSGWRVAQTRTLQPRRMACSFAEKKQ